MITFKLDKSLTNIGAKSDGKTRNLSSASEEFENERKEFASKELKPQSAEDLISFNKPVAATGNTLDVGNIKDLLDHATQALEEIEKLKKLQMNVTKEATELPYYTPRTVQLSTESANLKAAISDIVSNTTPNGDFILAQSQNYQVSSTEPLVNNSIAVGAVLSSLINPKSTSEFSGPTEAATQYTRHEAELNIIRTAKTDYSIAANKADNIVPKAKEDVFPVKNTDPDALRSVEEAQNLANSIANQVGSAYSSDEAKANLIEASTGNLDPSRVRALLS